METCHFHPSIKRLLALSCVFEVSLLENGIGLVEVPKNGPQDPSQVWDGHLKYFCPPRKITSG